MSGSQITIDVQIATGIDTVWTCWTHPEHITKWNFASDDCHCPSASNDLKIGGKYNVRMEAKDGSFGFDFVAVYDEVTDKKSLTYTMEDGRKVKTIFEPESGMTKITTTFDAEKVNPEELQRSGWQAILNNFKKYAEKV